MKTNGSNSYFEERQIKLHSCPTNTCCKFSKCKVAISAELTFALKLIDAIMYKQYTGLGHMFFCLKLNQLGTYDFHKH